MGATAAVAGGSALLGFSESQKNRESANKASSRQRKADAAALELSREQLDYTKQRDAQQDQLGADWYEWNNKLAQQEDARRFGLLPQIQENAQLQFDELMTNAGLTYDELTGIAYDAQGNMVGNANELYQSLVEQAGQYSDAMMENARFSDAEYADAAGETSADVVQAFDKARGTARRNAMRYGANPNSSDFARFEEGSALDQAKTEAGAINTERRDMRARERSAVNTALTAGFNAKTDAETTGRGAIDSATRGGAALTTAATAMGRTAIDSATRTGRAGITDALHTNLNTRSSQLGIVDPRIGMTTATNGAYANGLNTYNNQSNNYANQAASANAAASDAMMAGLSTAGMVAGYGYGANKLNTAATVPRDHPSVS